MRYKDIHRAQRLVATIIRGLGVKKCRKRYKRDRKRLKKVVHRILKRCNLVGTPVERYYELQFYCALLGIEAVWLPKPYKIRR